MNAHEILFISVCILDLIGMSLVILWMIILIVGELRKIKEREMSLYYKVLPVCTSAGKWGVFDALGEYLYQVFQNKEEAEKWVEEKEKENENRS